MLNQRFIRIYNLSLITIAWMVFSNSTPLSANVSLKNGNFFVGYTDVTYPGGLELAIERVQNSKSSFFGMFGHGWGNPYEVKVVPSEDGRLDLLEYGGGAVNRFSPLTFNPKELDQAVDSITAVAQKVGIIGNGPQLAAYKQRLRTDAVFRNDQWEKFRSQGKIQPQKLANGTQLRSNRFSYQFITKVADGYVRSFDTGKVEKFDESGRLRRVSDKNGNFLEIARTKDGRIEKIVDNFHRKMFFTFNNQGLLEKIEGENNKKAEYKYNSASELISSRDVDNNTYTYKYDTQGFHNLTEIGYSDKTTMEIAYYGKDKNLNVKSVKDRDGSVTEYDYQTDAKDRGHYAVVVKVKGTDGKVFSDSKYEYFVKNKPDGEEWTAKLITTQDGDRTETAYNETCGLPTMIKRNGDETSFDYDAKCHVTRKATPTEITKLHYDPKVGKVDRVEKVAKSGKVLNWSEFKYDDKGNLEQAKDSQQRAARLLYDNNGRIRTMIDPKTSQQISFKYNENSRPIEIKDPALGAITVSYTNSGEIKNVDSTQGRKVAAAVSSKFQTLLEIIRPAGVTLSP